MKLLRVSNVNAKVILDILLIVAIAGGITAVGYAGQQVIGKALTMLCGKETAILLHLSIMK